jgi:uncharacterized protein
MNANWRDIPIIDSLAQLAPGAEKFEVKMPRELLRDEESLAVWPSTTVVKYLFGSTGDRTQKATNPAELMAEHTQWGIAQSQFLVEPTDASRAMDLIAPFGDHFFASVKVDPHQGVRGTRELERTLRANPSIKSCSVSPFSLYPPIPINSKEFYVVYAKAEELGIPILVNVGIPGPRVPGLTQDPSLLDEVCWYFPDLKIVMKHGGEPWEDMCVKLMLKWPNLYYMTSAFTPRWYPEAIVRYMNTRGQDKVMFAGYWPLISYERVFAEFENLDLRDGVWEKFLHGNAARVFGLTDHLGHDTDDDR